MDSSSGESAPEMGASHSKYRAPPDSTFSVEEIAALIRIYDTVSDDTQTVVVQEKLRAVFPCACFEGFSAGLYDALRGEHEDLDFAQFVRGGEVVCMHGVHIHIGLSHYNIVLGTVWCNALNNEV
jgi:hypothetical protein